MADDQPYILSAEHLREIIELQSFLSSAAFDVDAFMICIVNRMLDITPATGAVIELHEGDEMVYRAASGSARPFLGLRIAFANSLSGLCVESDQILSSDDTSCDLRVNAEACRKIGASSMVVVPLSRRGERVGVLKVLAGRASAFAEHDLQTLMLMAGLLGGALGQQLEIERREQVEAELRELAMHDTLTGLPNRRLFYDRLEQALNRKNRSGNCIALMYLDIDHFKVINDTYGHAVGDELLRAFADRIRECLRASDTLARLGGDEFIIIGEGLADASAAEHIAGKIVTAMQTPFDLAEFQLKVGTSIGVALIGTERIEVDTFVQLADEALYAAKRAGRNQYHLAA